MPRAFSIAYGYNHKHVRHLSNSWSAIIPGRQSVTGRMPFVYEFEWDRSKASANLAKHAIAFRLAATVFKDPLAATIFDSDHSDDEQRWVTIGVVIHTFEEIEPNRALVRIISARRTTNTEIAQYEETYQ